MGDMGKMMDDNEREVIRQFRSCLDETDYRSIKRAFDRNYLAEGEGAREFRDRLLEVTGARYGCFASNGTLALYLALRALDVGAGDEVLVQDITFIASANAVEMVGATPVFTDILRHDSPTIDLDRIRLNANTRGIVLCHLFGTACENINEVKAFCAENGLFLLEDAAQALAIKSDDGHCGTFGDVGTFSFYADKTITTGEGGFVVTNNESTYEKMLYLRNQGRKQSGTFVHEQIGYNFRITDIQAYLGLSQLAKLDRIVDEKLRIYRAYKEYLGDAVEFLKVNERFTYIPFRVVIFVNDAQEMIKKMTAKKIEPRTMFYPLHKQPCYKGSAAEEEEYPNANECYDRGICLPTWVGLGDDDIKYVSQVILESL